MNDYLNGDLSYDKNDELLQTEFGRALGILLKIKILDFKILLKNIKI